MSQRKEKLTQRQRQAAAFAARAGRLRFEPKSQPLLEKEAAEAIAHNEIGHHMPDGTVYAGLSPDTKQPLFTLPQDEQKKVGWKRAMKTAQSKQACGHHDWRVPNKNELKSLFNSRAKIGGFHQKKPADSWYWSAERVISNSAWAQRFTDGAEAYFERTSRSRLRLVRDGKP